MAVEYLAIPATSVNGTVKFNRVTALGNVNAQARWTSNGFFGGLPLPAYPEDALRLKLYGVPRCGYLHMELCFSAARGS